MQLLVYDYNDSRVHKNVWDVYAKRASKLLLPMKSARKTFESYALMLNVPAEVRYKLLGHTPQTVKERHYQNWEWTELSSKIDLAHEEVLTAFESKELFRELLNGVSSWVSSNELMSIHLSNA